MVKINTDLIAYYHHEQLPLSYDNEYPKSLNYKDTGYIPPAEPHVIITDWFKNPQKWYNIPSLIKEQFIQTYVCYYSGLYIAGLSCAINTVELVLKYEYLRLEKNPDKLTEDHFGLGHIIYHELDKIKLTKYKDHLVRVNNIRIGIYHYNTIKLELILKEFDIEFLNNNLDYWPLVYYIYNLLSEIFYDLYGSLEKTAKHIKEGLDDYKRVKLDNEIKYE